jgi:tetratricopeptide (TPR) repeat protein
MIGRRDSDVGAMTQSAVAFEKALGVAQQEKSDYYLTLLNNNLGNVYVSLGGAGTRTEYYLKAISAYREALSAFEAQSDPLNHAYIQVSLGEALLKFAERDRNPTAIDEAVAAFKSAEEIYSAQQSGSELAEVRADMAAADALRQSLTR